MFEEKLVKDPCHQNCASAARGYCGTWPTERKQVSHARSIRKTKFDHTAMLAYWIIAGQFHRSILVEKPCVFSIFKISLFCKVSRIGEQLVLLMKIPESQKLTFTVGTPPNLQVYVTESRDVPASAILSLGSA